MNENITVETILKELNIELKDHIQETLDALHNKDDYSKKFLNFLFSSDLGVIIKKGSLPLDINTLNVVSLKGVHLVQLLEAEDITTSKERCRFYFNSEIEKTKDLEINAPGPKRILKLIFTDGKTVFIAMEFNKMPELDEFVDYWCKLKNKIKNSLNPDIKSVQILALLSGEPIIRRGVVLLLPGMLTFIKLKTENSQVSNNHSIPSCDSDSHKNNKSFTSINKATKSKKKSTKTVINDNIDIRSYYNFNFIQSENDSDKNFNKNKVSNSYYESENITDNNVVSVNSDELSNTLENKVVFSNNNLDSPFSQSSSVIELNKNVVSPLESNDDFIENKEINQLEIEIKEMDMNKIDNNNGNKAKNEVLSLNYESEYIEEDFQNICEYDCIDEFETFEERIMRDAIENNYSIYKESDDFSDEDNDGVLIENINKKNANEELIDYNKETIFNENDIIWVEGAVLNSEITSDNEIIVELGIHYPRTFPDPWNKIINKQVFLNLELAEKIIFVNNSEYDYNSHETNRNNIDILLAYVRFVQGNICLKVNDIGLINENDVEKVKIYFVGLIPYINNFEYISNYAKNSEKNIY